MNKKEQKQLITDLATSQSFLQSMIAYSRNLEGRTPTMQEVGLWFYSSGYMDCLAFQKQKRMSRPYKYAVKQEQDKAKNNGVKK